MLKLTIRDAFVATLLTPFREITILLRYNTQDAVSSDLSYADCSHVALYS